MSTENISRIEPDDIEMPLLGGVTVYFQTKTGEVGYHYPAGPGAVAIIAGDDPNGWNYDAGPL